MAAAETSSNAPSDLQKSFFLVIAPATPTVSQAGTPVELSHSWLAPQHPRDLLSSFLYNSHCCKNTRVCYCRSTMPPTAEGSAPWVFGGRNAQDAGAHPSTPVPPPRSEKRNPFSTPEDGNDSKCQLSSDGAIPRSMTEYPPRKPLYGPDLDDSALDHEATSPELDGDKATSDWETVAADDEMVRHAYPPPVRYGPNAFEVQDLIGHGYRLENQPHRPNTMFGPTSLSPAGEPQQSSGATKTNEPTDIRYSNFVNERRDQARDANAADDFSGNEPHGALSRNRVNTATILDSQGLGGLVASNSITSSSLTVDRFKYDDGHYAVFLRPGAEREVSRALHVAASNSDLSLVATQARADFDGDNQPSVQDPQFYDPSAIRST